MSRLLKRHEDIRSWAEARGGNPMMMDVPDGGGDSHELLTLTFGQHALDADGNEGPDPPTGGYQLVSWDDWFVEFDRHGFALKVNDRTPGVLDNDFEFVDGRGVRHDSPAAQQPPL
jgi:hypothetical protein